MLNYFRYLKEMRELKVKNLRYATALLSKVYGFVDSIPDIAELATKLKGLDPVTLQKSIAEELVNWTKAREEANNNESED